MNTSLVSAIRHAVQTLGIVAAVLGLSACTALRPATSTTPVFYSLEAQPRQVAPVPSGMSMRSLPTLIINPVHAAPGFDSQRLMYVQKDHTLAYFAHSEWVDTPARMLGPLLVAAIEETDAFGAVVATPASVAGDLRLDITILRLQHNFQISPSRVQFTLRAYLSDEKTRRVLAWREFSAEAPAPSDNAQGGVNAANELVQNVLAQLALFLALSVP
jgi:cholesterol transport system auxiliary component